jgi:hypothetical protein
VKTLSLLLAMSLLSLNVSAKTKMIDYGSPQDMSQACGDAIVKKLQADDGEVGDWTADPYSLGLDWDSNDHDVVRFEAHATEDVRDGYLVGTIAVTVKADKSCAVGEIIDESVGD